VRIMNILQNKFYACGSIMLYHVHADAHLSAALVRYFDATGAETSMHTAGVGDYFCCSGATLRRPHLVEGRAFLRQ